MRRRILAAVLLLLVAVTVALWSAFDWPSVRLLATYGLPPAGGPTGRKRVIEGIEFVEISPGYVSSGSHHGCGEGDTLGRISASLGLPWGKQPDHRGEECPPHRIEVRDTYWIATTEVSNEVFARFDPVRTRPPWSEGDRQPAVALSFEEAARFCAWLSEGEPGFTFRLPTETEWEFSCRAGSGDRFGFGEDEEDLPRCGQDWSTGPWAIGSGRPNAWGLFDLHGNAWEWCTGEPGHPSRTLRGGAWFTLRRYLFTTCWRDGNRPGGDYFAAGFRPFAVEGGSPGPSVPTPKFPQSQWEPVAAGDLVILHAERVLCVRDGSAGLLVHLAVENRSGGRIGIELGDRWQSPGPNQLVASTEPFRGRISEESLMPVPLDTPKRASLLKAFADGGLRDIGPGEALHYYREFNWNGRAIFARASREEYPWLGVSIKGQLFATNGRRVESLEPRPGESTLFLYRPAEWRQVPEGALVIE